jgi:hypothetical protein
VRKSRWQWGEEKLDLGLLMIVPMIITFAVLYGGAIVYWDRNPYHYVVDNGERVEVDIAPRGDGTVDLLHRVVSWGSNGDRLVANVSETDLFRSERVPISTKENDGGGKWLWWVPKVGGIALLVAMSYYLIWRVVVRRIESLTKRIISSHFGDLKMERR